MSWSAQAIADASRLGDYGRVVRLARRDARISQQGLGAACGMSQSAVSRLELQGPNGSYDMAVLAKAAAALRIPLRLVGLDEHLGVDRERDTSDVERRTFLAKAAATAAAPALATLAQAPAAESAALGQVATLRLATTAFRRMEGVTPSRMLSEPVLAHMRLVQTLAGEMEDPEERARLAALGSEVASFAGWLAWDMADHGSARTWYGTAVKAARRSRNRLLVAYQLGSLAQMEAHMGNAQQALSLIRAARSSLGEHPPAVAAGWLSAAEAVGHAAGGDSQGAATALARATTAVERVGDEDPPPWPWVFAFDAAKVESFRITCGALLGLPEWTAGAYNGARAVLTGGHDKQRALLLLDVATGQLAAGQIEGAFVLATRAVEIGLRRRSGRIIERARTLRRGCTSSTPPKVVRDFDDRLRSAYL